MACCPPGSWPALEAQPVTENNDGIETLDDGTVAYVARPSAENDLKKGIVYVQDIFAYDGGRGRGICQQFALAGYTVVLPNLLGDDAFGGDASQTVAWVQKHAYDKGIKDILVKGVLSYFAKSGITSVGAIGFCWGGLIMFHMSADPEILTVLKGCATCHTSLKLQPMVFNGHPEALDLTEKVQVPQLLCSSKDEPPYCQPDGAIIKMLKEKPFGDKCDAATYPNMSHGFVNRGDASIPEVADAVKDVIERSLKFFAETV